MLNRVMLTELGFPGLLVGGALALEQVVAQIDSASEEKGGHQGKKLFLAGTVSDIARDNLDSRGWDVTDQMRMDAQ